MRVPDAGVAPGERGAQDGVLGGARGAERQVDFGAAEPAGGLGAEQVLLLPHPGAQILQNLEVQVEFPVPQLAAARQRHGAGAGPRRERPQNQQRVAHGAAGILEPAGGRAVFREQDLARLHLAALAQDLQHFHLHPAV